MKKPDKKPDFLCMAVFCHTYLSPQSERRLCCASREPAQNFQQYIDTESGSGNYTPISLEEWWNSDHLRRIRRQMMSGEAPPECEVCNHQLLNTDVYRSYFWHLFKHHYDEIWKTTDDTGHTTMRPVSWDYRFSNLCNFKCRMCGDMLSSSWEAENRKHGVYNNNDPDLAWAQEPVRSQLKQWQEQATEKEFGAAVEAKTVEEIYWVGGEPLMYEQHWRYMKRIVDLGYADRVHVRYNTNLSRVKYQHTNLWELLSNFQNWQICASIDGIGQRGEYIRTGLVWPRWRENFEQGLKHRKNANQLKLDFTLTTPGLLEIKNLVRLSQQWNVHMLAKVTFAFSPDIVMSPMALPRTLLDELIQENQLWLKENATPLQQPIVDLLESLKHRPTFAEQWPEQWKQGAREGAAWIQKLDSIRPGPTMQQVLESDPRLNQWWIDICKM